MTLTRRTFLSVLAAAAALPAALWNARPSLRSRLAPEPTDIRVTPRGAGTRYQLYRYRNVRDGDLAGFDPGEKIHAVAWEPLRGGPVRVDRNGSRVIFRTNARSADGNLHVWSTRT